MEPSDILDEAANHADLMLRLVDTGSQPNQAEYQAHLLKTLTVIGGALVERQAAIAEWRAGSDKRPRGL